MYRKRYQRLYELLKGGKVKVRVVSANDAPFLHGKAGVIESRDGTKTSFIGSLNETHEGWQEYYEIVWEDQSPEAAAWVKAEFEYLLARSVALRQIKSAAVATVPRRTEAHVASPKHFCLLTFDLPLFVALTAASSGKHSPSPASTHTPPLPSQAATPDSARTPHTRCTG